MKRRKRKMVKPKARRKNLRAEVSEAFKQAGGIVQELKLRVVRIERALEDLDSWRQRVKPGQFRADLDLLKYNVEVLIDERPGWGKDTLGRAVKVSVPRMSK